MQVKFSAIEIKVQFTIVLEDFEQNFRLLMNDLSNLLERKNLWRGTIQITTEAENIAIHSSLEKVSRQHFQIISNQKKGTNVFHSHYNGGQRWQTDLNGP